MAERKLALSVLYVEDDVTVRNELAEYLRQRVTAVWTAENGRVGLDLYREVHPDIVIVDIRMPEVSGLQLAREIKEINPNVPVIVTTAYGDSDFLIEAIDIGINQYLLKPVKLESLMRAIYKCSDTLLLSHKLDQTRLLLSDYKNAIDVSSIVTKADMNHTITYVNDEFCRISGYSPEEIIGRTHAEVGHPAHGNGFPPEAMEALSAGNVWKGIFENRRKDGSVYFTSTTVIPICGLDNEVVQFITTSSDITPLVEKENQLIRQLYTDSLTGLPNRRKLLQDISDCKHPALILVNVDSFQEINDFYGNLLGDSVLVEMGERLRALTVDSPHRIYKMPTDEFAILFDGTWTREGIEREAAYFHEALSERPFFLQDYEIHISVTAGIAFVDGVAAEEQSGLANQADMALKRAKKTRRHFLVYDQSMQITREYEYNLLWTKKLKDAIRTKRIIAYFQPIVNNNSAKTEKYECLVRLLDADGTVVPPVKFLDVSKKTRLYPHITRTMLEQAFQMFQTQSQYEFSINLSVEDIMDRETDLFIKRLLVEYPGISNRVVFEILESEGIENYDEVRDFIDDVKGFGCKIAIDDFGTGYSNFQHIMRLSPDYIKIDASMIKNIDKDSNSQLVTGIISDFARKLNIKTIGEFVSSEPIYLKLREIGVDFSQGYFFGEPRGILQ
jgi:diguanylate cyclase (GGDEF)-like protein/PAS domain S-box-containing protein